jgi:hypothetical protein
MEEPIEQLKTLDESIKETLDSINDIVNDVELFGFSSINEREVIYGITSAVGIEPSIDTVMEIGCNVGEFYFYIERLLGSNLLGYFGVDENTKHLDITRFRVQNENTEFYNTNLDSIVTFISENGADNIKTFMDISVDWGVIINQFNDDTTSEIIRKLEQLIRIPNKGIVVTNKFSSSEVSALISELLNSKLLKDKFIFRSDFIPGWYSLYFYNNR